MFCSEFSRLAEAATVETQGKMIKFPFQPGPSPPTLTPVQKSVLENLPMILYRALEVSLKVCVSAQVINEFQFLWPLLQSVPLRVSF